MSWKRPQLSLYTAHALPMTSSHHQLNVEKTKRSIPLLSQHTHNRVHTFQRAAIKWFLEKTTHEKHFVRDRLIDKCPLRSRRRFLLFKLAVTGCPLAETSWAEGSGPQLFKRDSHNSSVKNHRHILQRIWQESPLQPPPSIMYRATSGGPQPQCAAQSLENIDIPKLSQMQSQEPAVFQTALVNSR